MPKWLSDWLKQPSSLRVLNILLGLAGVAIAQEHWQEILVAVGAVWVLIDGFYNRAPRK